MPYIITTKRTRSITCDTNVPGGRTSHWPVEFCRAVATLDDAHNEVLGTPGVMGPEIAALSDMPESGGIIGPLPDGTVIEVERIAAFDLGKRAGIEPLPMHGNREAEIIAAYNEAQQ
jgi:hypothetical protein